MVLRGETERGSWELVHRAPHPLLRPYARSGYEGFRQAMRAPVRRLEMPHAGIVLIIALGPAIDVDGASHTSFVAGLYDAPVVVSDDGHQACVQVNLTPLGARMLLGVPMRELSGHTVALDDMLDRELPELLAALRAYGPSLRQLPRQRRQGWGILAIRSGDDYAIAGNVQDGVGICA